jgi:hypothetical protein
MLTDRTEVILIKSGNGSQSHGFDMLSHEMTAILAGTGVTFRYHCLFVPIIHSWGRTEKKVVGVCIISGINAMSFKKKDTKAVEDKLRQATKLGIMNELVLQLTNFFNLTYMELTCKKTKAHYRALSQASRMFLTARSTVSGGKGFALYDVESS